VLQALFEYYHGNSDMGMIQQLEQIIVNYDLHHIDTFQIIQLCQKYDLYIVYILSRP